MRMIPLVCAIGQASKSSLSSVIRDECFIRSMGFSARNRPNSSAGDSDVGAIVGSGEGLGGSNAIGSGQIDQGR